MRITLEVDAAALDELRGAVRARSVILEAMIARARKSERPALASRLDRVNSVLAQIIDQTRFA
jgi:hypothetical protein